MTMLQVQQVCSKHVITQTKVVLAFLNCIADVYVYSFY